jgi:hypothetical protein
MALYLKEGDSYYKNIPSNDVSEIRHKNSIQINPDHY